jgi:hypothetical protein
VIARDDAEPAAKADWREDRYLDVRGTQSRDELAGDPAHPDPVAEEPNVHAACGCRDQRHSEPLAHLVGAKDVTLETHRLASAFDEGNHRIEGRRPIAQQPDAIPARYIRRRDPPEPTRKRRPGMGDVSIVARDRAGHARNFYLYAGEVHWKRREVPGARSE